MIRMYDMDKDWRFHRGEVEYKRINSHSESYSGCKAGNLRGPGGREWNDSEWDAVDLPHDYLSEATFGPDNLLSHGYRERTNAWYRKSFLLDEALDGKCLTLVFEGISVNAEIYFNGSLLGRSFSAYTELSLDLSDRAYFGDRPNVLAVHVNGMETEGWWYEGAGIYRHVRLYVKDALHIAHNGLWVKPTLCEGTENDFAVDFEVMAENTGYTTRTAMVRTRLWDGDTCIADLTSEPADIGENEKLPIVNRFVIKNPVRWDVDDPKLYRATAELIENGAVLDTDETRTGFRTILFTYDKGFFLNGRPLKLKGTCNHQDHAGVGVAVPDSIQRYRVRRLKEMGSNAYRCAHNPPAKEILDACDEYGILVMDENRRFETRDDVLSCVETMLRRDRNHPSIILWSLFNEEPLQNTEEGRRIFMRMKSLAAKLDSTRYIMGAMNGNASGAGQEMDVVTLNYNLNLIDRAHEACPGKSIFGSENASALSVRGCYKSDREGAQVLQCYDDEAPAWGSSIRENWDFCRTRDYFGGVFYWTGFDYRGEPTPFTYPTVSSLFGIMDTCGFPKDAYYYTKACFDESPVLHIVPSHWNFEAGEEIRVAVATNLDEVELFLNGASLGRKPGDAVRTPEWQVTFEAGSLRAVGYKDGNEVLCDTVTTAGAPVAIRIEPDRDFLLGDGHDTVPLALSVVDAEGRTIETADHLLSISVTGMGFLRGVGNGNPNSHESDVAPYRHLFAGHAQALVMSKIGEGTVTVRVTGEGLTPAELTLPVKKAETHVAIPSVVNTTISGFTASLPSEERPDATRALSDNDMNSFLPITFHPRFYDNDFTGGYRIFRAFATMPKQKDENKKGMLQISAVNATELVIYLNGEKIYSDNSTTERGISADLPKALTGGERFELRILCRAVDGTPSGIRGNVRISFA